MPRVKKETPTFRRNEKIFGRPPQGWVNLRLVASSFQKDSPPFEKDWARSDRKRFRNGLDLIALEMRKGNDYKRDFANHVDEKTGQVTYFYSPRFINDMVRTYLSRSRPAEDVEVRSARIVGFLKELVAPQLGS